MPTASDPAHGLLLESLPDAVVASTHKERGAALASEMAEGLRR